MKAGWEVKKLSEVTSKIGSGATPRGGQAAYKSEGISLIRSLNVHDLWFKEKNLAFIDDAQAEALSNVVVKSGDVLLNITGASIARCCTVPDERLPARVNQHVSILRPNPDAVSSEYLSYLLTSKEQKDKLLGIGDEAGATRQALTKTQLQNFPIPLPPLEEQKQIVAVLDAAFEGLTRARTHIETNLQNARELFSGSIASTFATIPTDQMKPVGEVAVHSLGKMLDKSKNKGSPRPYLRNVNVRWFEVDTSDLLDMRIEDREVERYSVRKGDLLICEGGYPGRCSVWENEDSIFFQKALHRVRFENEICGRLLMYYLYLSDETGDLQNHFSGTGIQHFTGKSLGKFTMPWPSFEKATEIVSTIEAMKNKSEALQAHYRQKLQDLDDLRQSLLQKAFAGELT